MQSHLNKQKIIIVDFGSQVTKCNSQNSRDLGVYSEIITPKIFQMNDYTKLKV